MAKVLSALAEALGWEQEPENMQTNGAHLQPEEIATVNQVLKNNQDAIAVANGSKETAENKLTDLQNQLTLATEAKATAEKAVMTATEKATKAENELTTAKIQITKLEATGPDGKIHTIKEKDEIDPSNVKAMDMAFQKELLEKHGL